MKWRDALATIGIAVTLTWSAAAGSAQRCLSEDEGEAIGQLLKSGDYKGVYDALAPGAGLGCPEEQFALGTLMYHGKLDMNEKDKKGEQEEGYSLLLGAASLGTDRAVRYLGAIRKNGWGGFARSSALSDCWQRAYREGGDIDGAIVKQCLSLEGETALWPSP